MQTKPVLGNYWERLDAAWRWLCLGTEAIQVNSGAVVSSGGLSNSLAAQAR